MCSVRVVTNLDECRELWHRTMPDHLVSDLWEFRACFHRHFGRPLRFLVAADADETTGLLPLCWIEEARCFAYFPGETWHAKTWLEQNRVICRRNGVLEALLEQCAPDYHIRYLLPLDHPPGQGYGIDETGYLFMPPDHDYDMESYFGRFSHRSAKRLKRELDAIRKAGVRYRYDDPSDFDRFVNMNRARFGSDSYFHDERFRESFRALMRFLDENGWLRLTAVLIDGEPAAVDMGCVYRGVYTLLGGGTDPVYPGVAKLINVHHMERACEERLDCVDFLCGDFSWKKLFHLTPRPLYSLWSETTGTEEALGGKVARGEVVGGQSPANATGFRTQVSGSGIRPEH